MRLFSSLGSRSGKRQRSMSEPSIRRPLSRQPLPPPLQGWVGQVYSATVFLSLIPTISLSYSISPSPPPSLSLLTPISPSLYSVAAGERLPSRQLASGSGSRGVKQSPTKPWPAGLWHHLPVRDPPPQVYHRGALFGGVRGDASHYNVHPEWPDYYGTSLNSDAVHWTRWNVLLT